MEHSEALILVIVGGVFLLLGGLLAFWGWREEKHYFDALASRRGDLREFMQRWPPRPQAGSLKMGAWVFLAIGALLLLVGLINWIIG